MPRPDFVHEAQNFIGAVPIGVLRQGPRLTRMRNLRAAAVVTQVMLDGLQAIVDRAPDRYLAIRGKQGVQIVLEIRQQKSADPGCLEQPRIAGLAARHDLIGGVRGAGLFVGVDLVEDRKSGPPAVKQAAKVMNDMARAGVLVGLSGPHKAMLKIRPPIVFSRENADQLVQTLEHVLASL